VYRPTLAVHVIWHPCCSAADDYARALFAHLFEDPDDLASHGLRIPVRLWRSTGDAAASDHPPPAVPPLEESARAVVVLLIDDEFLAADGWLDVLDRVSAAARPQDVLIGVSLSAAVLNVASPLLANNLIRLHSVATGLRRAVVVNRVTHALSRLVAGTRESVTVFISHAKGDGKDIAKGVRAYLQDGTGIKNFFDAQDLLEGSKWADEIRGAAARNVLLAVRTDNYATREWCRTEVLEAKRHGSPVIVLDALQTFEPRGFPYLGNAPSVRWRDESPAALEHLLGAVLRETLRFRHFPARVADLCRVYGLERHDHILPVPPELLTVLGKAAITGDTPLVYPDPPLGTDELAVVEEFAPNLTTITPTGLIARR
jgi:hypothetical protein